MKYEELSGHSREYIDQYARSYNMTREQAMEEAVVRLVVHEYEEGLNKRVDRN